MKKITFKFDGYSVYASEHTSSPLEFALNGVAPKPVKQKDGTTKDGQPFQHNYSKIHTLTNAVMVLLGERPIHRSILEQEKAQKVYNLAMYNKIKNTVSEANVAVHYSGISNTRSRRNYKYPEHVTVKAPRILLNRFNDEQQALLDSIAPGSTLAAKLGEIKQIIRSARDGEKSKISTKDLEKHLALHDPNGLALKCVEFMRSLGLSPGYADTLGRDILNANPQFTTQRPDNVSCNWAWQTNEKMAVYGGEITIKVSDDLAEEIFNGLQSGPGVANFGNSGIITPVLPKTFEELENAV